MAKKIVKREEDSSYVKTEGLFSEGYGFIPKLVTRDKRLTVEAKGIYAYISSFCGNGLTAFPSIDLQLGELNMSRERYYKHRKLLVEYGYLTITQGMQKVTYDDGSTKNIYSKNLYTIVVDIKKAEEQKTKKIVKKDKVIVIKKSVTLDDKRCGEWSENPTTENPTTENPTTENPTTNSNSLDSNSLNSNSTYKSSSIEDDDDEKTDLEKIMKYCQECNFKLKKEEAIKLLKSYNYERIIKAITKADSIPTKKPNPYGYMTTTLDDMDKEKTVNINVAAKDKTTGFNNFEPRKNSERYEYLKEQCLIDQATEEEKEEFDKMREWQ